MDQQILLFWAVVAGLLAFDNLVLVPGGGDYLKVGRRARLVYEPGPRFKARARDLVLLNPLNPFDRLVTTTRAVGTVSPEQLAIARNRLRISLPSVNALSTLGSAYLLVLLVLAALTFKVYFGVVLTALAIVHIAFWTAGVALMVIRRVRLGITGTQLVGLAFEALLVPGYVVNLGKRVWFKQSLDLAAVTVGLRAVRRIPDESTRDLYLHQMARRLDELSFELGVTAEGDDPAESAGADSTHRWFKEARTCLTASARAAG